MENVIHGYSEVELKNLPDNSVDMIFTSPPYADRRKNTYGGIPEDEYVEWFRPIAIEIKRVLKPTGSFFLNIKPHTNKGERVLYVFDLVLFLKRELGFWFVDEFAWTKNAYPGKYNGRFKNGFEPIYHFTKSNPNQITFNPIACGTAMKQVSVDRLKGKQNGIPSNGSGMGGITLSNLDPNALVRPSNVVHVHNVSNQYGLKNAHSATFPIRLVEFFIKSFTNDGDLVVDCFGGSGTTGIACMNTNREFILIDKEESNIELTLERIKTHVKETAEVATTDDGTPLNDYFW